MESKMKRIVLVAVLAVMGCFAFNMRAEGMRYNAVKTEIVANKLKGGDALSRQQAVDAVENIVTALSEVKSRGNKLLAATPANTDWNDFHMQFEAIESDYHAVWVIVKQLHDVNKEKQFQRILPDEVYARYTLAWREYNKWYSKFCQKQKKFKNCPY